MQFVKNGPHIPAKLLQAHEEGRVVFFCGAGISFPAKLPGFGGLVRALYKELNVEPNPVQENALKNSHFDTAITLLEAIRPTNEWRREVRFKIAELLKPDYLASKATQTHLALLRLANTSENKIRLITTNFDRIFKKVAKDESLTINDFTAPLLPIPKNRWDGLIYLHGLLPEKAKGADLDHLVVSSGDFGLAYLTERWAARFVSELFRSYTVCFVGYSLNDPVLRYMMDALAADRLLGENTPEMFAFGNFKLGDYENEQQQWFSKNVTPILYKNHKNHYYLHETLAKWSETYRDGLSGKEQIVVTTAISNPNSADLHDDYVRQLAWALSDPTGIPAKRFSTLDPAPPLTWLSALADIELNKEDLTRFGISDNSIDDKVKFNLFNRPAKSSLAPNMALSRQQFNETRWDDVMTHLGNWLARHLNNPDLVLFILKQGGILNSGFQWKISKEIEEQKRKQAEGDNEYFKNLKALSPDAVVSKDMLIVWSLVLAGYCELLSNHVDLYSWMNKYKLTGITASLVKEIKEILSPKLHFKKPYNLGTQEPSLGLRGLLHWDICLSTSHVHSSLTELKKQHRWQADCAKLLPEFSTLLKETMSLMTELGAVEELRDYSYIHQPSIKEHPQNKDYYDWTALIELTRDSWLSLSKIKPKAASRAVIEWWSLQYPFFTRLAFFAAAELNKIPTREICKWLNEDNSHWLWSVVTQREVLQLLATLPKRMSAYDLQQLLTNIKKGPQRGLFTNDVSDIDFKNICDREIWLRLEKIKKSGVELDEVTNNQYKSITIENPKWVLSDDEREEFPYWMDDGNGFRSFAKSPTELNELVLWLKDKPDHDHWDEDDWPVRCKEDFRTSAKALIELGKEGIWMAKRWREALRVWTEDEKLSKKAWRYLSSLIFNGPSKELVKIAWNLSNWLAKKVLGQKVSDKTYLDYFAILLNLPYEIDLNDISDPLNAAINHPVGILSESIFAWWYSKKPNDNDLLIPELKEQLNKICSSGNATLFFGKTIVASNVLSLFRVDPEWTNKTVIPWFKWDNLDIASMAWRSYLWSPRIHKGFLLQLKPDLLATAQHYERLGDQREQYSIFLTYISLQKYPEYKLNELSKSFSELPPEALSNVASALNSSLSSSSEKLAEYWEHRVRVFLLKVWPKQTALDKETINKLALLCITASSYFEEAFNILKHSFRQTDGNEYLTLQLLGSNLPETYPDTVLQFLDCLIGEPHYRPPRKLRECLNKITKANPGLLNQPTYKRLDTLLRRFE
jgi:hypothetical protein